MSLFPPSFPGFVYGFLAFLQEAASGQAPTSGAPASGAAPAAPSSPFDNILFPLAIGAFLFYFIAIRPASKERKKRVEMISAIKKGDRILLSCGLIGNIAALSERDVWVKVDDKNPLRMRFQKSSIQTVLEADEPAAPEAIEAEAK